MMRTATLAASAALAGLLAAPGAEAATLLGLAASGTALFTIDSDSGRMQGPTAIHGTDGPLVGIDWRPGNNMVYGITATGQLYTIQPQTGQATAAAKLAQQPDGAVAAMDFNPVADRLRLLTRSGASLRIHPDNGQVTVDGALKYAPAEIANAGKQPMVVAGAYTNSLAGTKSTELLNIDRAQGALVLQSPPNDGVLATRGKLGIELGPTVAFDILNGGSEGMNSGWLVTAGTIYGVDLANGRATQRARLATPMDFVDIVAMR